MKFKTVLISDAPKAPPPEKPPTTVTSPSQDASTDFQTGDRVWVNGNKPGYVHFVGGTQFAPGQWAGIVLDEPIGKNDGSVAGVRYFQCEDGRGIFTRPSKLSRTALPETEESRRQASPAQGGGATNESAPAGSSSAGNVRKRINLSHFFHLDSRIFTNIRLWLPDTAVRFEAKSYPKK